MTTGERIREARKRLGKEATQEWLAREIGVTLITVSRWERGLNKPFTRQYPAIAKALRVDEDWLLEDEAVPTPNRAESPLESALQAWVLGFLREAVATTSDRRRVQLPVPNGRRSTDPRTLTTA